mmetsp:Transcript_23912/g.32889  ORF Transcript_23912/g.32889 Transcript_23912/m.32889 type:complete len:276 (-) Transcript_23912:244-1071(-)
MKKRKSSALGSLFASYGSDDDEEGEQPEEEEEEEEGKGGNVLGIVAYGMDDSTPVSGEMVDVGDDMGIDLNLQNVAPSPSTGGQERPPLLQGPLLPGGEEIVVKMEEKEEVHKLSFAHMMFPQVQVPLRPQGETNPDLQSKIVKYSELKTQGRVISTELRKSKGYRNPDFLTKIVEHFDINELLSHFPKDVFDPEGYPKEDYYDTLAEQQRRALEKRHAQKREFVSGGTQGGGGKSAGPTIVRVEGIKGSAGGSSGSLSNLGVSQPVSKPRKWDV